MQSEYVSKSQFKAKALEYLQRVEATGEPVIITDKGRPTIELRRLRTEQRTPLERLRGSVIEYHSHEVGNAVMAIQEDADLTAGPGFMLITQQRLLQQELRLLVDTLNDFHSRRGIVFGDVLENILQPPLGFRRPV